MQTALLEIATIVVLGVGAQWIASRVRLPSILVLLMFGFLAGAPTGLLRPDERFGELLFPLVSIAVALILYEGGLTLRFSELRQSGAIVRNLCTVGAAITWVLGALAAWLVFDLSIGVALLLGAILVVTGPTVIGPLLRHIRPAGAVGSTLKWEGIVIDPIGAVLAVLVFEVLSSSSAGTATAAVVKSLSLAIFVGGGLGVVAAYALAFMLKQYWIPDFLQNAVSLMLVVAVFAISNIVQEESGLLAATVMGIVLANQKMADVRHIVEFKENLRVLLISALFIVLAARLDPAQLGEIGWKGALFVLLLVVVARPLSVFVSTIGSKLSHRERMFLAWMAPRGIVAAAVSSLFALHFEQHSPAGSHADAALMVPITFLVIIGTVAIYGLTAPLVAHRLGVADANPQGVLIVGAQGWARALASLLRDKGFNVLLVDSNRNQTNAARMEGLPTYHGSILADYALDEINLGGLGQLVAITPNDWINTLAVHRFTRIFGSARCFQVTPRKQVKEKPDSHKHLHGRWLFGSDHTYSDLNRRAVEGAIVKATHLTEEFDYDAFQEWYNNDTVPMFIITEGGTLQAITADRPRKFTPGQTLISMVFDDNGASRDSEQAR